MTRVASLTLVAAIAGTASAQLPNGLEAGLFFPTSSTMRALFGDQWLSLGPGAVALPEAEAFGRRPNIAVITSRRDRNRIFLVPVTWGTERPLGSRTDRNFQPYYRFGIGLYYADYRIDSPSGEDNRRVVGGTANAEVGMVLTERLRVSARYDIFTASDGYRFDGLTLTATLKLFEW